MGVELLLSWQLLLLLSWWLSEFKTLVTFYFCCFLSCYWDHHTTWLLSLKHYCFPRNLFSNLRNICQYIHLYVKKKKKSFYIFTLSRIHSKSVVLPAENSPCEPPYIHALQFILQLAWSRSKMRVKSTPVCWAWCKLDVCCDGSGINGSFASHLWGWGLSSHLHPVLFAPRDSYYRVMVAYLESMLHVLRVS